MARSGMFCVLGMLACSAYNILPTISCLHCPYNILPTLRLQYPAYTAPTMSCLHCAYNILPTLPLQYPAYNAPTMSCLQCPYNAPTMPLRCPASLVVQKHPPGACQSSCMYSHTGPTAVHPDPPHPQEVAVLHDPCPVQPQEAAVLRAPWSMSPTSPIAIVTAATSYYLVVLGR